MAVTRIPDVIAPGMVWPCTAQFARLAPASDNRPGLPPLGGLCTRLAFKGPEIGSWGLA